MMVVRSPSKFPPSTWLVPFAMAVLESHIQFKNPPVEARTLSVLKMLNRVLDVGKLLLRSWAMVGCTPLPNSGVSVNEVGRPAVTTPGFTSREETPALGFVLKG